MIKTSVCPESTEQEKCHLFSRHWGKCILFSSLLGTLRIRGDKPGVHYIAISERVDHYKPAEVQHVDKKNKALRNTCANDEQLKAGGMPGLRPAERRCKRPCGATPEGVPPAALAGAAYSKAHPPW